MAIFKKTGDGSPPPARVIPGDGALSIIGPGMRVVGDVVTEGSIRVEGRVEGSIRAEKSMVLGREGEVRGNIVTEHAVIGGRVNGSIVASSRLELQGTCEVEGEVQAPSEHLQIHEGARFNGQIRMGDAREPLRALPSTTERRELRGAER